jgi:stearoyl-CoA desaturase (delta-9 desaturase)
MNLFRVDVFMLGESYHNNHHKNPASINFGRRWHEIDPIYPVILLLKHLRIIKIIKPLPIQKLNHNPIAKLSEMSGS